MKKYVLLSLTLFSLAELSCQQLTASKILDRAIAFHDPENAWGKTQQRLFITLKYADGRERRSEIDLDFPNDYFRLVSNSGEDSIERYLDKGLCSHLLNGSTDISEADIKKHNLSCERTKTMRDYYVYLYGLPMKLRDKGTHLHPEVERKRFKGKEYLVLKVSYDAVVGTDTWYFYFDPQTYAMEVYQFFHDESKNDGEYILLSDTETVGALKIPKIRAWYNNSDDSYLGTDTLVNSVPLE